MSDVREATDDFCRAVADEVISRRIEGQDFLIASRLDEMFPGRDLGERYLRERFVA